jgi:hypothetical protein
MSQRWRPDGPLINPQDLSALLRLFREEAGLEFPRDTEYVIERKLQERLAALGLGDFGEYVRLLRSAAGRKELEHALDEVTTHETYFFREEYQLKIFQQELLPRLRVMTEGRRRLTLWSAGCSTGEEVVHDRDAARARRASSRDGTCAWWARHVAEVHRTSDGARSYGRVVLPQHVAAASRDRHFVECRAAESSPNEALRAMCLLRAAEPARGRQDAT